MGSTFVLALAMVLGLARCGGGGTTNPDLAAPADLTKHVDLSVPEDLLVVDGGVADMPTADGGILIPPGFVPVCSTDKWCINDPQPQGNDLYATFTVTPTDVWAVGDAGMALHLTGGKWQFSPTGTNLPLHAVWGYLSNDVWAAGVNGTLIHWNGTAWSTPVVSGTMNNLTGLGGNSSTDVWAVGDAGTILHWNGKAWTVVTSPTINDLKAVYAFSTSNVWAVGTGAGLGAPGTVLQWTGAAWNAVSANSQVPSDYYGVWGIDAADFWIVGTQGTILRHQNNMFTQYTAGTTQTLKAVEGTSSARITAVGDTGTVVQWNGTAWNGIGGSGSQNSVTDSWIVGAGGAMEFYDGQGWIEYPLPPMTTGVQPSLKQIGQISGTSDSDIWAMDIDGLDHYNGTSWSTVNTGFPAGTQLQGLWALSKTNVWAVGAGGFAANYNGTTWTVTKTGTTNALLSVYAVSASEAWAVGQAGTALHYINGAWTATTTNIGGFYYLRGVWGSSPSNVWAVGDNDSVLQWTGNGMWTVQSPGAGSATWGSVWGTDANHVWIAGSDGPPGFWNGSAWAVAYANIPGGVSVNSIFGFSPTNVWVAGTNGNLANFDGTNWNIKQSSTNGGLNSVWGPSATDIYAAGGSLILQYKP